VSVIGNGFLAYHIEVYVNSGQIEPVKATVKQWQEEFRKDGKWLGFPNTMTDRLFQVPGVADVVCEGPQSSVLIPLRMVKGMVDVECRMTAVVGTGPVSQAILSCFKTWGITLDTSHQIVEADSPVELSFRDPQGAHTSLRLYPIPRRRYQIRIAEPETSKDHLILNRFNQGLRKLAMKVSSDGGLVSLRPRELGRHDNIVDYIDLLSFTNQLVLSSRHGIVKQFARYAGCETPRGWPDNLESLEDITLNELASWLIARMPTGSTVVFHRYKALDSAFYGEGCTAYIAAPQGFGKESKAARIQGALLGRIIELGRLKSKLTDVAVWQRLCEEIVKTAFHGTDVRPWRYPSR